MPTTSLDPSLPGSLATTEEDYDLGSFVVQPADGVFEPLTVHLRGLLTYPASLPRHGKLPLVVLAHGRHTFATDNFRGLAYLAHHLSSHGYMCASVDLNDLGSPQGVLISHRPWIRTGTGTPQRTLTMLRTLTALKEHSLFGARANFKQVGLVGHSRGGEAACRASAADVEAGGAFGIRGVVAIAPDDSTLTITAAPLLLIYGNLDRDLADGRSLRLWDRARNDKFGFYVNGAVHNLFSSNWESDLDDPRVLTREQHQGVACAYTLAHFQRYLRGSRQFDDELRGLAPVPSLAGIVLHGLYEAADRFAIDDCEGPHDATTNSLGLAVTTEGGVVTQELDLRQFRVDAEGFRARLKNPGNFHQRHAGLADPDTSPEDRVFFRAEVNRMADFFTATLRLFAEESDPSVRTTLKSMLLPIVPDFELTAEGWARLLDRLKAQDAPELDAFQEPAVGQSPKTPGFLEAHWSATHAWNHETKGIALDWQAGGALYRSALGHFDATPFRWLQIRGGQNYTKQGLPNHNTAKQDQSFSVALTDAHGKSRAVALTQIGATLPAPVDNQPIFKTVMTTLLIPLTPYAEGADGLDLRGLVEVRIVLDQTSSGSLVLDDIAFTN